MLGKIPSNKEKETIKTNKGRNLPPVWQEETMSNLGQPEFFQLTQGAERSRFTTAWFSTKVGYFRVTLTIVGPKTKEPKGELPLSDGLPEDELKKITDIIKAFQKQVLSEDAIIR